MADAVELKGLSKEDEIAACHEPDASAKVNL